MAENEQKISEGSNIMNPGEVISPGGLAQPQAPVETSVPAPVPQQPEPATTPQIPQQIQNSQPQESKEGISWIASEFILHEKTGNWYLAMIGITVVISGIIFAITRDAISTGAIIFGAIIFGVYASRKPRQLNYHIGSDGIQIGPRSFNYAEFKGFSIVQEGAFSSIVFSPLKRFSPLVTIYYPPEQEDEIASIIASNLPFEERKQDPIDRLMHKIGF